MLKSKSKPLQRTQQINIFVLMSGDNYKIADQQLTYFFT
jgi:hypothetical protein